MFFYQTKIYSSTVDKVLDIINKNSFPDVSENTCTYNGYQTGNIINFFSPSLVEEILPLNNFSKKCFHFHYIEYFNGGHQKEHNHAKFENFSSILYLNDSDGDTVFGDPINKSITPEKGTIVVFDAKIIHRGEQSFKNKKILVGGIERKINV